nr:MAG TPA: hypothetical protein [Caudoviricetes sp.]
MIVSVSPPLMIKLSSSKLTKYSLPLVKTIERTSESIGYVHPLSISVYVTFLCENCST